MRRVLKILLIVAVVIVIGLVIVWFKIDSIAKAGVEQGGAYALGVPTMLDSASVRLLRAEVGLGGLTVSNPEGFKTPHFIKVGKVETGVAIGSLMTDTVEVSRIEIDGLDLNIEAKLSSTNVTALLDNIKARIGKGESGRKLKVGKVIVRNVVAHVQVLPVGGNVSTLEVKVPEIVMDDVTSDNAGGVAMSQLIQRLVPAILAAVVEKGKGILPDADVRKLSGELASTTQVLGKGAAKLAAQAGGEGAKLFGDFSKAIPGTGQGLEKGVGKTFEGLFGGKKKAEEKPK